MCQQFATYHVVSEFSNFGDGIERRLQLCLVVIIWLQLSSFQASMRGTPVVGFGKATKGPSRSAGGFPTTANSSHGDPASSHISHLSAILTLGMPCKR
jgi:hypothetical protein